MALGSPPLIFIEVISFRCIVYIIEVQNCKIERKVTSYIKLFFSLVIMNQIISVFIRNELWEKLFVPMDLSNLLWGCSLALSLFSRKKMT